MIIKGLFTAGSLIAGLAWAGAAAADTPVTFQLNWYAGGANAGFAAALQQGYYKEVGLDVTIIQGNGSANTAQMVASGQAQLAYADAVPVSQLIAKGAPMKILATIYQSNPNEVESLKKTGITSIADLKGKKIGVPAGSSQQPMLPLLYKANNIDASEVTHLSMPTSSMVPALLQGQVDAILGSVDDYAIQLKAQGADIHGFPFADHGVPTVSTSIFASESFIEQNPDVLRNFIAASLKGWSFALDNPDKAIDDVKAVFPEVDTKLAAAQLAAIPPLFCSGGAEYLGKATDAHWANTQDLLSQVGLLPVGTDPTIYYTNEFLPPDADLRPCK
ncbi:ABC transporter substrate-binding protein [Paracoccus sp. J55]|uniref:ABC transporter substrate-binding protein n=1 Tax=Paracoccus sp. J55 TaxID=935849 RepID=UPI00055D34DA|nr:ABC transporter substrate-binding protein [Paracoccus sp. J55]